MKTTDTKQKIQFICNNLYSGLENIKDIDSVRVFSNITFADPNAILELYMKTHKLIELCKEKIESETKNAGSYFELESRLKYLEKLLYEELLDNYNIDITTDKKSNLVVNQACDYKSW